MSDDDHIQQQRRAILDAAMRLFDSQGYAATTMEEVAARAGMSKGSIYNYFKSKHDLFNQLFGEATSADEAEADRLLGGDGSARKRIEALLDFWFGRLGESRRVGRLTLEFWATAARERRHGDLAELLQGTYNRWLERLVVVIGQGVDEGEFSSDLDPSATATLLLAQLQGLLLHMILNIGSEVDEAFLASLKHSVLAGLGAGGAG